MKTGDFTQFELNSPIGALQGLQVLTGKGVFWTKKTWFWSTKGPLWIQFKDLNTPWMVFNLPKTVWAARSARFGTSGIQTEPFWAETLQRPPGAYGRVQIKLGSNQGLIQVSAPQGCK